VRERGEKKIKQINCCLLQQIKKDNNHTILGKKKKQTPITMNINRGFIIII